MFSAGRVIVHPERGQAMFPGRTTSTFDASGGQGLLNDTQVVNRDQGQNQMNPYGIPGSQGPSINIARAARAIRARLRGDAPIPVVTIDRLVDPQANITGAAPDLTGKTRGKIQLDRAPVHNEQEQIPGRTAPGMIRLNQWKLPNRQGIDDPESIARTGGGLSRLAGGQAEGVGMVDSHSTEIGPGSINESPAPTRIPRVWNDGLAAAAGIRQYAFQQQNYRIFIPHIYFAQRHPVPTRGVRAVSGVRQQDGPTASRIRIPAVFVPSAVG